MRIHLASNPRLEVIWALREWGAMKQFLEEHMNLDSAAIDMKVHLADTPPMQRLVIAEMAGHPYRLFSYFYIAQMKRPEIVTELWDGDSTIMDSGLFSFMFGSEQGKMPETLEAYDAYTQKYIQDLKAWNYKGWFVESDTHKLLGMPATFELRKHFKEYEDRTIFVWHQPEGLDGLEKLALRYDYIAISIPELRIISGNGIVGGGSNKVPRMANDLLKRIHSVCKRKGKKPPKVHLLGCTVEQMMQTTLAYSCDSTSWLSGVRFGNGYIWNPKDGLMSAGLRSEAFIRYRNATKEKYPLAVEYAQTQKNPEYYFDTMTCAHAFGQYQRWLDSKYTCVTTRGKQCP